MGHEPFKDSIPLQMIHTVSLVTAQVVFNVLLPWVQTILLVGHVITSAKSSQQLPIPGSSGEGSDSIAESFCRTEVVWLRAANEYGSNQIKSKPFARIQEVWLSTHSQWSPTMLGGGQSTWSFVVCSDWWKNVRPNVPMNWFAALCVLDDHLPCFRHTCRLAVHLSKFWAWDLFSVL